MARIPDTVVDEVLARASIVDVVGEVVRLKPKGGRYWGLCPFHNEKSPSFTVNAERGFFYCFGCQAKGSTASFLMQYEGLSFPEAVRKLADRVGVTIPAEGVNEEVAQRQRKERDSYFRAMEYAQVVYERALWSGKFPEPLAYLEQRGVDEATARAFGLGFAPPAWGTLAEWGGRAGIRMETMQKAGLVLPRKSGDGAYDRFRNRVMFPVVSLSRKTLAFSGRTLDAEERAKYVNSPETTYYTKGKHLFGLNVAASDPSAGLRGARRGQLRRGLAPRARHLDGVRGARDGAHAGAGAPAQALHRARGAALRRRLGGAGGGAQGAQRALVRGCPGRALL